jgi:hypothetical protein
MQLECQLKIALYESRLLILGAQVMVIPGCSVYRQPVTPSPTN